VLAVDNNNNVLFMNYTPAGKSTRYRSTQRKARLWLYKDRRIIIIVAVEMID